MYQIQSISTSFFHFWKRMIEKNHKNKKNKKQKKQPRQSEKN